MCAVEAKACLRGLGLIYLAACVSWGLRVHCVCWLCWVAVGAGATRQCDGLQEHLEQRHSPQWWDW